MPFFTEKTADVAARIKEGKPISSKELWDTHVMDFNFELNEEQLLEAALERGYVHEVEPDAYVVNLNYVPVAAR